MKTLLPLLVPAGLLFGPAPALAQQSGAVVGRVELPVGPARKWVSRYPGSGASSGEMDPVPVVVYLEGDLPAGPAPDSSVSIRQKGRHFVPAALAVRAGTVVRFPNDDPVYHNVFSYSGPRFDLGRYPPGDSREVTFDRPGVVRIFCEVHELMRAVVVVTDHGFAAVVGEDGTFRFDGVPTGTWTVKAYHPDAGTLEAPVTVQAGGTARVTLEPAR